MYRLINPPVGPGRAPLQPRAKLRRHKTLTVPLGCLYSLGGDGVNAAAEAALRGDPAWHENIRVPGSPWAWASTPCAGSS